ncbi:hypothetical protein JCM19237_1792 [Photobacterium aphoticum]|uniref:Uncharacterized protein n=1 Tax=Photobacterium aphoticum TaxID=754436 RepID=A0A090RF07_9GAMM|nr:hypothetical protein JCM19237_1792 [Photobacterium aphoticum]
MYFDVLMNVIVIWTVACMTPGANVILTINSALSTSADKPVVLLWA